MDAPLWVRQYVGIPFRYQGRDHDGLDCYGLIVVVHREVFDHHLPDYQGYGWAPTRFDLMPAFSQALEQGPWAPTETPGPGDSILLRVAGQPIHCGVVVSDTHMLHALNGVGVCVERFDGAHWARRVCGFFRYAGEDAH